MTTGFRIGTDWERKGMICWNALPGDASNRLPAPLTWQNLAFHLAYATTSDGSYAIQPEVTEYGMNRLRVTTDADSQCGIRIGSNASPNGTLQTIPTVKNTLYRIVLFARCVGDFEAVNFLARAFDVSKTRFSTTWTGTISETYQRIELTYTEGPSDSYLTIEFRKNNDSTPNVVFDVTGMMLIENAVAPQGFNAGGKSMYDNLSNRVISANWFLGMRQPYQDMADNSVLQLVLDNSDKLFSPENTASSLYGKVTPFKPVRIQSNDGTTTRTHWMGWVETIQPDVSRNGKRQVKITATGVMQFYKAAESKIELQENKRTDQIIAELIKEVVVPPALTRAWLVGREGNSELGATTYLADTTAYSSLDEGKLTLGMAADNWVVQGGASDQEKNSFDVYRAIGDIVAAEHGKFLFNREGKALFWNRHALLKGIEPPWYDPEADPPPPPYEASTFDDTMTDLAYAYASIEQTKNEVIVVCHPRKTSVSATDILWELGDAIIRVEPGKTREVFVKYEDEDGKRVGARDVTVTDVEFEKGTATVTVEAKANGANLKLVNSGTKAALVKSCVIKGRKIVDSGEMEAKAINQGSIIDYGRRTMRINLPSIDSLEHAQYIADFERDRRSQPRGEVSAITVLSHGKLSSINEEDPNYNELHKRQLELTLGDVVTVKETQTAHERNYHIIGEAHELTVGATLWKTTWYLEPAPSEYPWRLGVPGRSRLGPVDQQQYPDEPEYQMRLAY